MNVIPQIGISAQLPSGRWTDSNLDYDSFFEFLLSKREAYEIIPQSRFNVHQYVLVLSHFELHSPCAGKQYQGTWNWSGSYRHGRFPQKR